MPGFLILFEKAMKKVGLAVGEQTEGITNSPFSLEI